MKLWVDIHSPTRLFLRTNWEGLVVPAIGDLVIYGNDDSSWVFKVVERSVATGRDPMNMEQRVTHVVLKVDSDPPEGFQP